MNDDITSREIELVDAILMALQEKSEGYWQSLHHGENDVWLFGYQHGYVEGYCAAQKVVASVLNQRGFEIGMIEN